MRITQNMLHQMAVDGMQTNLLRLSNTQRQAVTGKRVSRPQDDPFAVEQSLGFRQRIKAGDSILRNVALSQDWLNATDKALGDMVKVLTRAQSLALQGANDTLGADERASLATEVDGLLEQAVAIGNARHGDHYLFSGFQINTRPFTEVKTGGETTAVTYNGDHGAMLREAEPGINITINTQGDPLLSQVFDKLIELRDNLRAAPFSTNAVSSVGADLKNQMNQILDQQAVIGTKVRRLQTTAERVQDGQTGLKSLLSNAEDADMAQVVSDLQQQEFVYRTALAVNAKVINVSLLDYLR